MRFKQFASLLALAIVCVAGCGRDDSSSESPEMRRGYRLVYAVHWDSEPPSADSKDELIQATKDRLESLGFPSEVKLLDDSRLEIKIPTPKKEALGVVRQVVPRRGRLELRIVATAESHGYIIQSSLDSKNEVDNVVYESGKAESLDTRKGIGKWVRIGRVTKPVEREVPFRVQGFELVIRDAKTKRPIKFDPSLLSGDALMVTRWLQEHGHQDVEMLVAIDDGYDIQNEHIKTARGSFDQGGSPSVSFEMNDEGAWKMDSFTSEFKPRGDEKYRLAIIIDDEVVSAPNVQSTISARGEITGQFTFGECNELACLLGADPLPAVLSTKPLEEHAFEDD